MEYKIVTDKYWLAAMAENYPDLTEEASMSVPKLRDLYGYDELIPRREPFPLFTAKLEDIGNGWSNVYVMYSDGWEYLGKVNYVGKPDFYTRYKVRTYGGQHLRVIEGERRDKKEEVSIGYYFTLVIKGLLD